MGQPPLFVLTWAVLNNSWKAVPPQEPFAVHVNIGIIGPSFLQVVSYFLIPKTQHAARVSIIVAAMKQEGKLGLRDTVTLRSHLPVHFTGQNLVQ